MSADDAISSSELPLAADERWGLATAAAPDRRFWMALAAGALAHVLLIIIANRSAVTPLHLGGADGIENAISISIVSEADLNSRATVAEEAEPPPGAPAAIAKPAEATAAPRPPEPKVEPPEVELDPQSEPKAEAAEAKPNVADAIRPSLTEDTPNLLAIPETGPAEPKKAPPVKTPPQPQSKPQPKAESKPERTAKLDLTPPAASLTAPSGGGGRNAAFERPPGITRSGANSAFGRDVIKALQKSMPELYDTFGRVTVRITLKENGDVADVQVVQPSNVANLDQYVVFAARQTTYPFPPPNSVPADRIFNVRYIYH